MTGLEPATSGVTGRHSNQLSYTRTFPERDRITARCDARLGGWHERVKAKRRGKVRKFEGYCISQQTNKNHW